MHFLQYIHWDPDPSIFGLPFRWYGLLFASSFFFGYIIIKRFFSKEGVPENWLESLTIYMALSTVIGARLGHCFFYDPDYYLAHPIEIFMIWEGGLASHGAAIGIITGLYLWTRRVSKRNVLWILDRIVIVVALSGLTIRLGNLVNSEILGTPTTASYGFVFPKADQGESLQAKWEGEHVDLSYQPQGSSDPRTFEFYRSTDDSHYVRLQVPPILIPPGPVKEGQGAKFRDNAPGTRGRIHYVSAEKGNKPPLVVPNGDSLSPRVATFEDPFSPEKLAFAGRWEGDKVHLKFDMRGLFRNDASRGSLLLRSNGDDNWTVIHRGVLGGNPKKLVLDTLDLPTGIPNPHYKLVLKEDESLLVARHPAQIYEAGAYTLIFVFLLWFYYRHDGKIPLGRFFGIFLILVFGMRILIEFAKEEQAEFMAGSFLTMGQWLSIPFVLLGIFFTVRSYTHPKFPAPLTEPDKNQNMTGK
ncbi:MAG TPA: prolipoprotein diacylglyceryl transferase [Bacteroidia bacterium]|nr:prolipoprotein diacylglyceryl transferase [Bacteroidia bacterium]